MYASGTIICCHVDAPFDFHAFISAERRVGHLCVYACTYCCLFYSKFRLLFGLWLLFTHSKMTACDWHLLYTVCDHMLSRPGSKDMSTLVPPYCILTSKSPQHHVAVLCGCDTPPFIWTITAERNMGYHFCCDCKALWLQHVYNLVWPLFAA